MLLFHYMVGKFEILKNLHNFWEGVHLNKHTSLLLDTIYSSYFSNKYECLDTTKNAYINLIVIGILISVGFQGIILCPNGLTNDIIVLWTSDCYYFITASHIWYSIMKKKKNISRFLFFRGAFVVIILKQKSARTSDLKEIFFFHPYIKYIYLHHTRSSCEYVKLTYHG